VIPEPLGGAHQDHNAAIANLRKAVTKQLTELSKLSPEQLLAERYKKFRRVGEFAGDA
jgi:acetyl-CoA carboxylase carboxyl transferase subunit alpha